MDLTLAVNTAVETNFLSTTVFVQNATLMIHIKRLFDCVYHITKGLYESFVLTAL